jgi:hypothetical protein
VEILDVMNRKHLPTDRSFITAALISVSGLSRKFKMRLLRKASNLEEVK